MSAVAAAKGGIATPSTKEANAPNTSSSSSGGGGGLRSPIKLYLVLLVLVELLVIAKFLGGAPPSKASSWFTTAFDRSVASSVGGGLLRDDDYDPLENTIHEDTVSSTLGGYAAATTVAGTVFIVHFVALIVTRVALLAFRTSPPLALFAAIVHALEIPHFSILGHHASNSRGGAAGDASAAVLTVEQTVVMGFIYTNAVYFTLHFLRQMRSYVDANRGQSWALLLTGGPTLEAPRSPPSAALGGTARFGPDSGYAAATPLGRSAAASASVAPQATAHSIPRRRRWARVASIAWSFLIAWSYTVPAAELLFTRRRPADLRPEWAALTSPEAPQVLGAILCVVALAHVICGAFSFASRPAAVLAILVQAFVVLPLEMAAAMSAQADGGFGVVSAALSVLAHCGAYCGLVAVAASVIGGAPAAKSKRR